MKNFLSRFKFFGKKNKDSEDSHTDTSANIKEILSDQNKEDNPEINQEFLEQIEESQSRTLDDDSGPPELNSSLLINNNPSSSDGFDDEGLNPPLKPTIKERVKIYFPILNRNKLKKQNLVKDNQFHHQNDAVFFEKQDLFSANKFNWNDFIVKIFSPYNRHKIHNIFIVFFVVTLSYLIGKGMALFFDRTAQLTSTIKSNLSFPAKKSEVSIFELKQIADANIFKASPTGAASQENKTEKTKKDIESIICLEGTQQAPSDIKLLDTVVLQDAVKSVAAVQSRGSSDLLTVREGDRLSQQFLVSKISRMRVVLKNLETGDCEFISNEESISPAMPQLQIHPAKAAKSLFKSANPEIKNRGNSFSIKKQYRDKMVANISEVLTQAKALQITNPDGSFSFKMTEVMPGSVYSQLNIQNDDIINSINGKKIENLNELVNLLGKIKEIDHFQIGLKRNGMNENFEYNFE